LRRRTTGPGGKGRAEVQVLELVTEDQQVDSLTTDQKLARILAVLEDRGVDIKAVLTAEENAPTPLDDDEVVDAVEDDDDDDL